MSPAAARLGVQSPAGPERSASSSELLAADLSETTLNKLNTSCIDARGHFSEGWERTLRRSINAIVSIRVNLVKSFDTERATSSQATGFVVDAERGLILTNRHVITPGPITAEAIFHNHEEVPVYPVYRDPEHDFGFLRFDVSRLRYHKVMAIPLAPELARVGIEIRVVGNDAGEKLSILAGTLARLDRDAPKYGIGQYNDLNTFYFQAASGTSGGSSGSPVLDIHGNAIAMNAGGLKKAASSFYIPLDRVARALACIQAGRPVTRGTLQCVFLRQPYDEARRLGLDAETEGAIRKRFPAGNGLLVVDQVIPQGPADGRLAPGDVVTLVQGAPVVDFVHLADLVDNHVGETLSIDVQRGGARVAARVAVQSLHDISPDRFLWVSGAVVHALSFQLARSYMVPPGGVFVASPGYMLAMAGISRGAIITHVNGNPTPHLDDFVRELVKLPDASRVPFRTFALSDVHRARVAVVQIDRHWHPCQLFVRNDATGLWDKSDLPPPPRQPLVRPGVAVFPRIAGGPPALLAHALVSVEFHIPYQIDGVHGSHFVGAGLIVDVERGLVITDANTVPIYIGDLSIIIARSITIPARIVFQHPLHNYCVISYDPSLIVGTDLCAATLSPRSLSPGDAIFLVGLSKDARVVSRQTVVSDIRELFLPECKPPRFRAVNLEVVEVDTALACQGGVLADADGAVRALWLSYAYQDDEGNDKQFSAGLALDVVRPVIAAIQRAWPTGGGGRGGGGGKSALPRSLGLFTLGLELWPTPLADARPLGLSQWWIDRLEAADPERKQVIAVRRVAAVPAAHVVREGDVILMAGERAVTTFGHVLDEERDKESVKLLLLRDGAELTVDAPTVALPLHSTDRLVGWGGVILQAPHAPVLQQCRSVPAGVYSSWWWNGSPAHLHGLRATIWITEVDGRPVPDLDAFLRAVCHWQRTAPVGAQSQQSTEGANTDDMEDGKLEGSLHGAKGPPRIGADVEADVEADADVGGGASEYLRLKTIDFNNRVRVITIKPDTHYWPAWELRRDEDEPSGWRHIAHVQGHSHERC